MTEEAFNKAVKLIETKLGLKPHSMSLIIWQDRIHERMAVCRLNTYEEYVQLLQTSTEEMQELIELMINSETWFFREKRAFDYLFYKIKLLRMEGDTLKVLSLACSTGEEPYSIAIVLFNAGLSKNDFRIDAIDISQRALDLAEVGKYRENSFRSKDMNFREKYFNSTSSGWVIKNQIKEPVFFYQGNILENGIRLVTHSYQFIFCRNLLIYLNQKAQKEVLYFIKSLLARQGILFVSSAETSIVRKLGFQPILFRGANAFIYKA